MKFNINDYTDKNCVMHVTTESQAKIFCKYLHEQGKEWADEEKYINNEHFTNSRHCYLFNRGQYCTYEYARDNSFEVLEFPDFEWEEEYEITKYTPKKSKWAEYFVSKEALVKFMYETFDCSDDQEKVACEMGLEDAYFNGALYGLYEKTKKPLNKDREEK